MLIIYSIISLSLISAVEIQSDVGLEPVYQKVGPSAEKHLPRSIRIIGR
jgi:hypothetical protein